MPMLLKYKSSPGLTPRATHSQFAYEKRHILKRECSIRISLIYLSDYSPCTVTGMFTLTTEMFSKVTVASKFR